MIRRCLIVDVETGGLDPAKDPIVEIGAIPIFPRQERPGMSLVTLALAHGNIGAMPFEIRQIGGPR